MEIIKKEKMIDGTKIQIENWNNSYPNTFEKNSTIACYPISKYNVSARWCNVYPERVNLLGMNYSLKTKKKQRKIIINY